MRKSLMSLWLVMSLVPCTASRAAAQDFRYVPTSPLSQPQGIAVGRTSGRTFVADTGHHVIRDVIPSRPAVVFAGALDVPGNVDGPVAQARFNNPTGLSYLEQTDTLYVADTGNHTIRKIQNGIVTTIAGLGGIPGSADGMGSAARFNEPRGVDAVYYYDTQVTTVLVADTGNHTIRKISQDGVVTTIAGLAGVPGSADGVGRAARFNRPWASPVNT